MEIINLIILIAAIATTGIWTKKKLKKLQEIKIEISDENSPMDSASLLNMAEESDELAHLALVLQTTALAMMKQILQSCLVILLILAICIWIFLEESFSSFAQPIFFLLGSTSQLVIGLLIFKNYSLFDPKIVQMARGSKWVALNHLIRTNNFITLTNQILNLLVFSLSYYLSTFFCIDLAAEEVSDRNFEKFHRRFLGFGFGSIVSFFIIKSLTKLFIQGSSSVVEIMARQTFEGLEEDHPKNPSRILQNISESFLGILLNCVEFNALTNMGLCVFQDFFVTKAVYTLDRGFLNAVTIYSFGMIGTLVSMAIFKNQNKLKNSDSAEYSLNVSRMRSSGIKAILISILLSSVGAFFIMWNCFPDSIAVYNPFEKKIHIRNLNNIDSFIMFATSGLVVLALVANSLLFTRQDSSPMKSLFEASKICLSSTVLQAEYWSTLASLLPVGVFFLVLYYNYQKGNIYGVTMEYLGVLTYFQCMQFFHNFN